MVWCQYDSIIIGWTWACGLNLQIQMRILRIIPLFILSIGLRQHTLPWAASSSPNVSMLLVLLHTGSILKIGIRICIYCLCQIQNVCTVAWRRWLEEKIILKFLSLHNFTASNWLLLGLETDKSATSSSPAGWTSSFKSAHASTNAHATRSSIRIITMHSLIFWVLVRQFFCILIPE